MLKEVVGAEGGEWFRWWWLVLKEEVDAEGGGRC